MDDGQRADGTPHANPTGTIGSDDVIAGAGPTLEAVRSGDGARVTFTYDPKGFLLAAPRTGVLDLLGGKRIWYRIDDGR